ncbi:MAG: hypothetical protein ACRD1G_13845 [Acidimicrobiales bacterium]
MTALAASAALAAMADMDTELAHDGSAWDVGLKLRADAGFDQASLAMRAGVRQGDFMAFVDLFGGRWGPMAVVAVRVATFSSRCFGLIFGRSFAEGCGLSFAGTEGILQPPGQVGDLSFELGNALQQGPTAGTGRFFHTLRIAKRRLRSCAFPATEALNNYVHFRRPKRGKMN